MFKKITPVVSPVLYAVISPLVANVILPVPATDASPVNAAPAMYAKPLGNLAAANVPEVMLPAFEPSTIVGKSDICVLVIEICVSPAAVSLPFESTVNVATLPAPP